MENEIAVEKGDVVEQVNQISDIDVQISTAKRFPRNENKIKQSIVANISNNKDFASKCRYSKPVGRSQVNGISVHLARLMARYFGNMRVESKLVRIEEKIVVCEAVAFDLESNFAVKRESIRSIFSVKENRRYPEDLINTTIAACKAIAYRDAVLDIIPEYIKSMCEKVAIETITGDLSNETKLLQSREAWVNYFKSMYDLTEIQALSLVGCITSSQLTAAKLADFQAVKIAIESGDFDIKSHFNTSGTKINPELIKTM